MILLSSGCTTTGEVRNSAEESALQPLVHTIVDGDRLSDISRKYTGRTNNWEEIAAVNGITDPRFLRIGDTLVIPANLVSTTQLSDGLASSGSSNKMLSSDKNSFSVASSSNQERGLATTSGALGLQRAGESSTAVEAAVLVQPVQINRSFELQPIDPDRLESIGKLDSAPPMVKVVGSYFPKGIYQQPANYSTLMMRVAPGTVFQLESEVNDWYKIVTDQGIGYLRVNDGRIIAASD